MNARKPAVLDEIETERLRLLALSLDMLRRYSLAPEQLESELGFLLSRAVLSEPVVRAIYIKGMKMETAPERDHAWFTYWIMGIKDQPFGAGLIGFKGSPNNMGEVEIGYGIDPRYEGQGYTTEAVRGLLTWAFSHPRCWAVTAETRKDNAGSIRILQKVGMRRVDEGEEMFFWRLDRGSWHPVDLADA